MGLPRKSVLADGFISTNSSTAAAWRSIWLVSDLRGKTFALRKPHFDRARRRFVRGCQVLSQLNESEFIVGYVEHGKLERTLYLLMDYVRASEI